MRWSRRRHLDLLEHSPEEELHLFCRMQQLTPGSRLDDWEDDSPSVGACLGSRMMFGGNCFCVFLQEIPPSASGNLDGDVSASLWDPSPEPPSTRIEHHRTADQNARSE